MNKRTPTVDFYFDFSSTNSYFAAFLLPDLCRRAGARINWLPLHAAALFRTTGFDVMAMPPAKARYLWRDHQRWAQLTGLPFRRPSRFPIKTSMALRCALAASRLVGESSKAAGDAAETFTQAVFRAYWERDQDIADPAVLATIAASLGIDSDRLLAESDSASIRTALTETVEQAIARDVFGVPTFFVGDEMFWGKDRLDFVRSALTSLDRSSSIL